MFVAAHTSAGKTVVAEYAFALATKVCSSVLHLLCFPFSSFVQLYSFYSNSIVLEQFIQLL